MNRLVASDSILKVVLTGAESTGKTTMAAKLAQHYDCPVVAEQLRLFVDAKGSLPEYDDFSTIVSMNQTAERIALAEARRTGTPLVLFDTDSLSLEVFWMLVFGRHPTSTAEESQQLPAPAADLYLLMGDDIPWVADPGQRDGPEVRKATQPMFLARLEDINVPFVHITGSESDRMDAATLAIDQLLLGAGLKNS